MSNRHRTAHTSTQLLETLRERRRCYPELVEGLRAGKLSDHRRHRSLIVKTPLETTANPEGENLDIYTLAHLEASGDRITKALNAQLLSK